MTRSGVVRGGVVEFENAMTLPEGTRVSIIPSNMEEQDEEWTEEADEPTLSLGEWLKQARELRSSLPATSDSTDLLHDMRIQRASR